MTTFADAFLDLLRFPGFGLQLAVTTADNAPTATTTSPTTAKFANQTTHFEGHYLWIPSAAAASDQVRTINRHVVTAGATTFHFEQTANFGEDLTGVVGFVVPVHPDVIMDAANEVLERLKVRVEVPLMHGPFSGDMQGANVLTDWSDTGASASVQTTATEVLRGAQSLVITDSGAGGGYVESGTYLVGQGKSIIVHFEGKAEGTGEVQVLDGDGNTQADVAFTERQWVYGSQRVDFDNEDDSFTLRLVSKGANDEVDWQRVWFVRLGEYSFMLPSWITNRFVVKGLVRKRHYTRALGTQRLWMAESDDDEWLFPDVHYRAVKRSADVNPRRITLTDQGRDLASAPLMVLVDCPWSAPYGVSATVTSYSSSSLIPQDIWVAGIMETLGRSQNWPQMEEMGRSQLSQVYVEDEMETETRPRSEPWRGPAWYRL